MCKLFKNMYVLLKVKMYSFLKLSFFYERKRGPGLKKSFAKNYTASNVSLMAAIKYFNCLSKSILFPVLKSIYLRFYDL